MSSLLTAFRISQMRKQELKKKEAEIKRKRLLRKERREQQARVNGESLGDDLNPISNPADIQEAHGYRPPYPEAEPDTKIWTFLLDEEPYSIVFYKDTLDVYCNGEEIDSMQNFPEDDTSDVTVDFCVGAHKARISIQSAGCSNGVNQLLTIDGIPVPQ